jgi:glycosyltransferase involved in cell wall biosynthesis
MKLWLLRDQFRLADGDPLADALVRAGHMVTLLAAGMQDQERILASGVRLATFASRRLLLGTAAPDYTENHPAFPYNIMAEPLALSYELADQAVALLRRDGVRPDVIALPEAGALPYYLIQRRLVERHPLSNTPVVLDLHGPQFLAARANHEPRHRFPGYWVGQMERFGIVAADGLLATSRFLSDELSRELPQVADQIAIIPPFLNLLLDLPTPIEQAVTSGDLLCPGALELRLGAVDLLPVCVRLWEQGRVFQLTLLGADAPFVPRATTVASFLRQRYARWIESGNLVIDQQPYTQQALYERMARAAAIVLPAHWDASPQGALHAIALGRPVVAAEPSAAAELLAALGMGVRFRWDDPGACAAAIEQVLDRPAPLREPLADIGRVADPVWAMTARLAYYEQAIAAMHPRSVFPSAVAELAGTTVPARAEEIGGLLSVVIPFYNLGAYIEETVASVVAASYRPLEVVVLDDGSSDAASLAALERVRVRYGELVRIVRTPNGGLALARNAGAEAARGEFLALLDADDLVAPQFYEQGVDVLRRYRNLSYVFSWIRQFGAVEACLPTWNVELPFLLARNMLAALMIIRRADFLAFGRNRPEMAYAMEDHESWVGLAAAGCLGASLPDPLVFYRQRADSMLHAANENQLIYLFDQMIGLHPELYQRWGPEVAMLLIANGQPFRWPIPAMEVSDYKTRYEQLQQRLAPLRPFANLLKWLLRRR